MIAGLGEKTDFVASAPNADAERLKLTAEEKQLFLRVGAAAQIFQLVRGSGFPEAKTLALLMSLKAKGAIVNTAPPKETIDLSEEKQREILELERALETQNLFVVFNVPPGSTAEAVRRSFYEMSRKFHPDRFFKRNIGSYRARIELAYRRLSQAHETLTDPNRRKAYLRSHPELDVPPPPEPAKPGVPQRPPPSPPRPQRPLTPEEEKQAAERRMRFAKHPYLAKAARVSELVVRARSHVAKSEWGHAYTDLHMAQQLDGRNEEVNRMLAEVRAKNELSRADADLKRGLDLIEQGNYTGAIAAFKSCVGIDARNAKAAFLAAKLMWDNSADPKDVQPYAQKAVDNEPKNVDHHLLLATVLEAGDTKVLAQKHWEEALKLDPENAEAKKHVKGRWPF